MRMGMILHYIVNKTMMRVDLPKAVGPGEEDISICQVEIQHQ